MTVHTVLEDFAQNIAEVHLLRKCQENISEMKCNIVLIAMSRFLVEMQCFVINMKNIHLLMDELGIKDEQKKLIQELQR